MNTIGDRIKYLRKNQKVTQKQLAEATDIQRGNISNYEHNRFKPNTQATLKIAHFFGVTLEWLTTGDGLATTKDEQTEQGGSQDDIAGLLVNEVKELLHTRNIPLDHSNLDTLLLIIRNSVNLYEELTNSSCS